MAGKYLNTSFVLGMTIALVFIVFSLLRPSPFEVIETHIYDAKMRLTQAEALETSSVGLINIDHKSITNLGSWPWPRYLIAQMIDLLDESGAKVIGVNIPFIERQPNPALAALKSFYRKFEAYPFKDKDPTMNTWVLENLKQTEEDFNTDKKLVESVQQSGNIILPIFVQTDSVYSGTANKADALLSRNFIEAGRLPASMRKRLSMSHISLPFSELAQNALGLGHDKLALEKSMSDRSHPLFLSYKGAVLPSFPLRLAMAYLDLQPKEILLKKNKIQLGDRHIPLFEGEYLIKTHKGASNSPQYSFVDILQTKQVPPTLNDKIVLIGFNAGGSMRVNPTVSPRMTDGEFIANILDSIINKNFMLRPSFMIYIEGLMVILLGGFVPYVFPRLRPLTRLGLTVGLSILTLSTGLILFIKFDVWLKVTYIIGAILTLYLVISIKQILITRRSVADSVESNRFLGLSFQNQGLLDLAFDKFRRLPVDNETKNLVYALGLEYERAGMIDKAITTYEYIKKWGKYRDLDERIHQLEVSGDASALSDYDNSAEVNAIPETHPEKRTHIGRYQIIEELGEGSMGKVYKALDPTINRLLAIKTIRLSDEFEEDVIQEIRKRFSREAEIAGQLSHPAIGTIYDAGEDGNLTYIAMEFVEGVNVEEYTTKDNLLSFRRTLEVVADVAEALDFAHKADVIHRDIKPANIMLLENGDVKVTDFGIAKAISSSRTKTGMILGTPNYMSPEQIMGQKIDLRSDIFSLGILFFQLLTGELPFHGENLSSLLYQITQVKHPSVQTNDPIIPKICDEILNKALAKAPKDRFKSAGEMERVIRLLSSRIDSIKKKGAVKPSDSPENT